MIYNLFKYNDSMINQIKFIYLYIYNNRKDIDFLKN